MRIWKVIIMIFLLLWAANSMAQVTPPPGPFSRVRFAILRDAPLVLTALFDPTVLKVTGFGEGGISLASQPKETQTLSITVTVTDPQGVDNINAVILDALIMGPGGVFVPEILKFDKAIDKIDTKTAIFGIRNIALDPESLTSPLTVLYTMKAIDNDGNEGNLWPLVQIVKEEVPGESPFLPIGGVPGLSGPEVRSGRSRDLDPLGLHDLSSGRQHRR